MNKDMATQIKEALAQGNLELVNQLLDSQTKPSRQPKTAAKKTAKKASKKAVKKTEKIVKNIPPGAVQGSGKNLFNPKEFAREAEVVNAAAFDKKVKRKKGYKRQKKEAYKPIECFCRGCGKTFEVPPALAVEKYRCNDCITKPLG
jgi:hypothetical protein